MESFLLDLYGNSQSHLWGAFVLGLIMSISPCPMATNIAAIGYISKDIENRRRVFLSGLVYTGGRAFVYTALAAVLLAGGDYIEPSLKQNGEKFLGPLLLVIGVLMLDLIPIRLPSFNLVGKSFHKRKKHRFWQVFLLGAAFALAFCPYSAGLYFLLLMPMTISSSYGLLLPVVFAIATSLPIILVAWLLAYSVSGVGNFYNKLKSFELWFRRTIAILFVGVGIYYLLTVNLGWL